MLSDKKLYVKTKNGLIRAYNLFTDTTILSYNNDLKFLKIKNYNGIIYLPIIKYNVYNSPIRIIIENVVYSVYNSYENLNEISFLLMEVNRMNLTAYIIKNYIMKCSDYKYFTIIISRKNDGAWSSKYEVLHKNVEINYYRTLKINYIYEKNNRLLHLHITTINDGTIIQNSINLIHTFNSIYLKLSKTKI